jgi:hypothetical protein
MLGMQLIKGAQNSCLLSEDSHKQILRAIQVMQDFHLFANPIHRVFLSLIIHIKETFLFGHLVTRLNTDWNGATRHHLS